MDLWFEKNELVILDAALKLKPLKLPAWVMQMVYPRWKELLMLIWLLHLIQIVIVNGHCNQLQCRVNVSF